MTREPKHDGADQRRDRALVVLRDLLRFVEHVGRSLTESVGYATRDALAGEARAKVSNVGFEQGPGRIPQRTVLSELMFQIFAHSRVSA